jgi:uncharacterized protein (TIGR03085 family)
MTASSPSLADRERAELADLLEELGSGAPTCCAGWTTAHLAAHLVVRDRRPDALPGYALEMLSRGDRLAWWSHRLEDRLQTSTPYADVVARLRSGPPAWSPLAWPTPARVFNTAEFAIHHEDVRRSQPGWRPRALPPADQDTLWTGVRGFTRLVRRPLVLRRSDATRAEHRVGSGEPPTVTGQPLELLLWLSGRKDVARVAVS